MREHECSDACQDGVVGRSAPRAKRGLLMAEPSTKTMATKPIARRRIKQYVMTGRLKVDEQLLQELGFGPTEAAALRVADQVRRLANHFTFPEPLTIANARQLLEWWHAR